WAKICRRSAALRISRLLNLAPIGAGGEGVNALKPQTTQGCPQVSREGAGRRVVVARCFQRRDVNCKWTGAGPPPPHPAPPRGRGRRRGPPPPPPGGGGSHARA